MTANHKIMNLSKDKLIYFLFFFICVFAALFLSAASAYAAETETISGNIGETEFGSDVKKLVLSGVTQDSGDILKVDGDCVIEIAEGTDNALGIIVGNGNLEFTGGGSLTASTVSCYGSLLVFNHTGDILVNGEGISLIAGDVVFNSGTVTCDISEDMIFPVITYAGSVYMNGGSLSAVGVTGAIYAGSEMDLEGGELIANASGGAAFNVGKGESNRITIGENFTLEDGMYVADVASNVDGVKVSTIVTGDSGKASSAVQGSGPDAEKNIAEATERLESTMYQENYETEDETEDADGDDDASDADIQSAEPEEDQNTGRSSGVSALLFIILCVAGAAAAAFAIVKVSGNKKRK